MDNRFIPGELVLAEDEDLAPQFGDDLALVLGATVLEHVLDHVVTVLVLHEALRLRVQLLLCGLRVRLYWGENECDGAIASRWIHRQSNLMFTLNSDKDRRKNSLSHSIGVNEPCG